MRWSRLSTKTLVKLGIFALCCMALTVWLAARIGNVALFSHRTGYTAILSDASGLQAGDAVKIAGVTVGQVQSVGVDHGEAAVKFGVTNDVRLRQSTGVGLRWLDVIGDKVLYLYPGSSGPWLSPGGTLGVTNDVTDASVGQLLDNLSPFLQSIDPSQANAFLLAVSNALQGDQSGVRSLLDNAANVSQTLGNDNAEIGAVIDDFEQVATATAAHSGDLASVVSNLATVAHSLAGRNSLLDQMVGNLSRVTGEFGGLLSANSSNLDGTISNLDSVAREIEMHQGDLARSLATLPSGLAPYQEISSFGQWFQIQVVYSCLADETVCSYYQPTNQPGGSSPVPGLPTSSGPAAGGSTGGGAGQAGAGGGTSPGGLSGLYGPLTGLAGKATTPTGGGK